VAEFNLIYEAEIVLGQSFKASAIEYKRSARNF
jgi:hypothetical protein